MGAHRSLRGAPGTVPSWGRPGQPRGSRREARAFGGLRSPWEVAGAGVAVETVNRSSERSRHPRSRPAARRSTPYFASIWVLFCPTRNPRAGIQPPQNRGSELADFSGFAGYSYCQGCSADPDTLKFRARPAACAGPLLLPGGALYHPHGFSGFLRTSSRCEPSRCRDSWPLPCPVAWPEPQALLWRSARILCRPSCPKNRRSHLASCPSSRTGRHVLQEGRPNGGKRRRTRTGWTRGFGPWTRGHS